MKAKTIENQYKLTQKSYYPFGMQMPGRSYSSDSYRYGFNGMEKDDEISGQGNSYTAMFWQYDSRLGRRWNVDPVDKPYESSYASFANNPIVFVDPLGNDTITFHNHTTRSSTPSESGMDNYPSGEVSSSEYNINVIEAEGKDVFYYKNSMTTINDDGSTSYSENVTQLDPFNNKYSKLTKTYGLFGLMRSWDSDKTTLAKWMPKDLLNYLRDKSYANGDYASFATYNEMENDRRNLSAYSHFRTAANITLFASGVYGLLRSGLAASSSIVVSEQTIVNSLKGSSMQTLQGEVSLPMVQRYANMLKSGSKAPPIKVANGVIIDGNHRYVAARILGMEVETVPGTISQSQIYRIKPMSQTKVSPIDWGGH